MRMNSVRTQSDHIAPACEVSTLPINPDNALTIDVEDYFQVEAFSGIIDRKDWEDYPRRVEYNMNRLLDIFAEAQIAATFFTLGWVAQRHPQLVQRIVAEGHELASHGSDHHRADRQSFHEFRSDIQRSKATLEDIAGVTVSGYRAPTFSISAKNGRIYEILMEAGFRYSSSVYPIVHDLYGDPSAPRRPFAPIQGFLEIPLTTVRVLGRNFPASGGGYFRLLPYHLSRAALRLARRELNLPSVFYMHPWEIDPEQPRQRNASHRGRFRHYFNLSRTEPRLRSLLRDFHWNRMDRIFLSSAIEPTTVSKAWRPPLRN
jgi:polysaccharide deacetylase family protein (PEP-CTERM system associated)